MVTHNQDVSDVATSANTCIIVVLILPARPVNVSIDTPSRQTLKRRARQEKEGGERKYTVCTALTLFTLTYGFDSFPPDAAVRCGLPGLSRCAQNSA